ncbi:phage associated protein [Neisseria gonorrhoeae]|uniref:BRO-N domain-containing protein n=2 Tax=Neisseria gonorrhoeae TaxID=485 RepID=UPI0001F6F4DD|nr:BRO family protein [Neisseria gonorrhoeae]SBO74412.1 phage associated protein [Neisseria gonorrhoeae]
MQNTISVFSFKSQNVRTQILGAEPWFCLGDVAEILQIQNARQLPLKDQGIQKSSVATKKGNQELLFINEPNLYRVIFRSRKAEAVKFQDWIFEEVIPQIRKTGGYQITPKTTADDRTGLRRAVAALVGRKGIDYSSAYSMIHQRFNVESVEDLPAGKLPEAVAYVHALTLHTGLTGEVLDAPPKAEPKLPIDGNSLADIAAMVYYGTWMIESGKDISAPLKQLGCRQAVTMWTVWHETRSILKRSAAALEVLRGYADKDASDRIAACLEGIYGKAAAR